MSAGRYKSRKFLLAVAAFAVFTGLLIGGHLGEAPYVELVKWALAGYLGANVLQKGVEIIGPPLAERIGGKGEA